MKNVINIVSSSFLIAIYCLTVGLLTAPTFHFDGDSELEASASIDAPLLLKQLGNPQLTGIEPVSFGSASTLIVKIPLDGFVSAYSIVEHRLEAAFSQYSFFSISFLVKYRKSDSIFPFHYFW